MTYIPFTVLFIAHYIYSVYRHSAVDKKVKLFVRCVYPAMYAFQIYINTLSYQVAEGTICIATIFQLVYNLCL